MSGRQFLESALDPTSLGLNAEWDECDLDLQVSLSTLLARPHPFGNPVALGASTKRAKPQSAVFDEPPTCTQHHGRNRSAEALIRRGIGQKREEVCRVCPVPFRTQRSVRKGSETPCRFAAITTPSPLGDALV